MRLPISGNPCRGMGCKKVVTAALAGPESLAASAGL
jgi:hypothetical protein